MPLHTYNDRLMVGGRGELITTVQFYSDDGKTVTMPLARLEEILFQAGYTIVQDNN